MNDLVKIREKDAAIHATPYQSICFSMEDLFNEQSRQQSQRQSSRKQTLNNTTIQRKGGKQTNVVKPIIRQSYHEMINHTPQKLKNDKTFAYKVSKI